MVKAQEKEAVAEKAAAKKSELDELDESIRIIKKLKPKGTLISFTVKDRLVISSLLPKETNLLTQILIRDIVDKCKIDQKEMKDIEFIVVGNGYKWNEDKAKDIEISFTDAEFKILSDAVNELDKKNKVTQELLDLCMKIKNN